MNANSTLEELGFSVKIPVLCYVARLDGWTMMIDLFLLADPQGFSDPIQTIW